MNVPLAVVGVTMMLATLILPATFHWRLMRTVPGAWPRRCLLGLHAWEDVPDPPVYVVKNGNRVPTTPQIPTRRCRRCGWTVEDWIYVHRYAPPRKGDA